MEEPKRGIRDRKKVREDLCSGEGEFEIRGRRIP
jgi:hypothetical protein